jgi:hypothetical protein
MRKIAAGIVALLSLAIQAEVFSQTCSDVDGAEECAAGVAAQAQAELDRVNTGNLSGDGTATDDFNPRLQVAAETLGLSGEGGDGIVLSLGNFLRKRVQNRVFGDDNEARSTGQHHKLVVKLEESEVFGPLLEAIADPAISERFRRSLSDFDNVSVDLRFSLDTERHGRDLQRHADLIDALQRSTLDSILQTEAGSIAGSLSATNAVDAYVQDLVGAGELDAASIGSGTIDEIRAQLSAEQAAQLLDLAAQADAALGTFGQRYEAGLRGRGLFHLVDLVNNQPQILLSIQTQVRDDLVGPDEQALKLSYEFGGVNVNGFKRFRSNQQALDVTRAAAQRRCPGTSTCLLSYVEGQGDRIESSNRFAASLSFVNKDGYQFNDSGVALTLPSERSLVGELSYGRYLRSGLLGGLDGASRIDVAASYEDVRGDPERQNRGVAKITFSRELSDGLFLTLGIVWANKPEYRSEVDEELSARAGINYKLGQRQGVN